MNATDLGVLILRLVIGLTFAAHGAQKAFGWWGGSGFAGWQAVMERLRFRPAVLFAAISMAAELVGGLLLAVGLLTPLATMVIIGQFVIIIVKSHRPRGFWNRDNGYEFPLALAAGVVAIALIGPGAASIDSVVGLTVSDTLRIVLIAVGLIGGFATLAVPSLNQPAPGEAPAPH
jgi:putative oxidoreductase